MLPNRLRSGTGVPYLKVCYLFTMKLPAMLLRTGSMSRQRQDWIRAGTVALRHGGVGAVRVEALARELGVTKGSFYWHFRDRGELLEALLAAWASETDWLLEEAAAATHPTARLRRFFELASRSDYPPDLAIFAWARQDESVARQAREVEERRIAFLAAQLRAQGLDHSAARERAELGYLATLGWIERRQRTDAEPAELAGFADLVFRLLTSPVLVSEPAT